MAETAVTISHEDHTDHGRYVARIADSDAEGELTWKARGNDARVAHHTFTPPEMRGQGIAAELVRAMVADAREQGFKIVPQCPYVADKFDENPEWSDLRA